MKTCLVVILAGLTLTTSTPVWADDLHLEIANSYSQSLFNTMSTEIHHSAQRNAWGMVDRQGRKRTASWPKTVPSSNIASHVFSISELADMRFSDPKRLREWLSGKTVSVRGTVKRSARNDRYLTLIDPKDDAYRVWVAWDSKAPLPPNGADAAITGTIDFQRTTYARLSHPKVGQLGKALLKLPQSQPSASLEFQPSPETSQAVIERLTESLAGSLSAGQSREDLHKLLTSGQLQRQFAELLKPYGYSDRNLADVIAAQMILTWQMANQTSYEGGPAAFKAVQQEFREALGTEDWVETMSNEDRQQVAETLSLGTMLVLGRYGHASTSNSPDELKAASEDAWQLGQTYAGVDLRTLNLTPQGFVKR